MLTRRVMVSKLERQGTRLYGATGTHRGACDWWDMLHACKTVLKLIGGKVHLRDEGADGRSVAQSAATDCHTTDRVRVPAVQHYSPPHSVQTGFGVYQGPFPGGKAAGA
jgi:hypothetical protein